MFMRDTFARRANKHRIYPSADCRFCELNTCSFQTEYPSEAEKNDAVRIKYLEMFL